MHTIKKLVIYVFSYKKKKPKCTSVNIYNNYLLMQYLCEHGITILIAKKCIELITMKIFGILEIKIILT